MIKRIRFATAATDHASFPDAWPAAVAAALDAPADVRPVRAAACTVVAECGPEAPHEGIGLEWFTDADHLRRFEVWASSEAGSPAHDRLARLVDPLADPVLVADEHVRRGAGWLARRWRRGGDAIKHMSIARRADGLTAEEFSVRWRDHAGSLGATPIPEDARGLAYVQNHPRPSAGPHPYDAVNEVYFDDLDGVQARLDFFARNRDAAPTDDLFGESWSFVVREQLLRVDSAR